MEIESKGKGKGEEVLASPQDERKIEAYSSALINVVYSKETQGAVVGMLKSGDPMKAVPQAILQINAMVEGNAKRGPNNNPELGILLNSNILLTQELLEVGSASGFFEVSEEERNNILESAMSKYIENGLADKSIDPVELQSAIEPLMNEEQRAVGLEAGQKTGVPESAGVEAAMETYAGQKVDKARSQMATEAASRGNQMQGAMAQAQSQGGQ